MGKEVSSDKCRIYIYLYALCTFLLSQSIVLSECKPQKFADWQNVSSILLLRDIQDWL